MGIFTIHYTIGTLFLPEGNFLYLSQIPDIYRQYEIVNGKTDFLTFIEENFLEFENKLGFEDKDDPFENEEQQIPFTKISFHINPAFPCSISEIEIKIKTQTLTCAKNSFYIIKKYTTEKFPVFHPPKYFFV
ncbi:MAG: hypothetical protein Fur0028_08360 [Bacteroidales bacterium]